MKKGEYMYNIGGMIVPGKNIGDFKIGWTSNELLYRNLIERDYSNKNWPESDIHDKNKNIVIYLNEDNIVQEIVAMNNYKGKVNRLFDIGDCLKFYKNQVKYETSAYDSEGYFYFPDMPGLRVLTDKWDERGNNPIKLISIFDPELGPVI